MRTDNRALTLPELLVVSLLLGIAAAAFIVLPNLGRDRGNDLEAAAAADSVLTAATSSWRADGTIPDSLTQLASINPTVRYRTGSEPVGPAEIADTASVALVSGPSGSVGVAVRSASGACLLTRLDLGDGSRPQTYGLVAPEGGSPCNGDTALTLPTRTDPERDGADWTSPLRLP